MLWILKRYCHSLSIIKVSRQHIFSVHLSSLLLLYQLEPPSDMLNPFWGCIRRANFNIFSLCFRIFLQKIFFRHKKLSLQWIQCVMSPTTRMRHNFISLAQGWSHCICCSVRADSHSHWGEEEGAQPLHEAPHEGRGWGRQGRSHRCAQGRACWGGAGCQRGQTKEEHGRREGERTAPRERWTPPGNMRQHKLRESGRKGGWRGWLHLHLCS